MPYKLRNESIVIQPKYNFIKYVRYSILFDGAALWNALDKKDGATLWNALDKKKL